MYLFPERDTLPTSLTSVYLELIQGDRARSINERGTIIVTIYGLFEKPIDYFYPPASTSLEYRCLISLGIL